MWLCTYVLQNVHRYGTTGYVHVIITDSGDSSDCFTIMNCITNAYARDYNYTYVNFFHFAVPC